MNKIENKLSERLTAEMKGVVEGVVIKACQAGNTVVDLEVGKIYDYYDLASLTKVIFSTSALMYAYSRNQFDVNAPVSQWLSWWPHRQITLAQILSHTSKLRPWQPFYQKLDTTQPRSLRFKELKELLRQEFPSDQGRAVYSDLNFLLVGFVLEEMYELSLEEIWAELKEQTGLDTIHFNPDNVPTFARELYGPTEVCEWRNKIIQGEVHDDNAWALGGVAPHAGLFGTIDDVCRWGCDLLAILRNEKRWLPEIVLRKFVSRHTPEEIGDWALGFMLPTPGRASCGRLFSEKSFGHTGFTGTSVWMDPTRDLCVAILSNRTHPDRKNDRFVQLRPKIHDWIMEEL